MTKRDSNTVQHELVNEAHGTYRVLEVNAETPFGRHVDQLAARLGNV